MKIPFATLAFAAGIFIAGCSGSTGTMEPPTCDVYVENNRIIVAIDLPAEDMEYRDTHDLTPPGFSGTPREVNIESGGLPWNIQRLELPTILHSAASRSQSKSDWQSDLRAKSSR
ncbi:MAG: hypothetical protein C4557_02330 [Anaerolineaceae bacterium]|jgi:hypothetical protein|nr:MAG: hypothetical protein C4557_02330 [Anaerolineaceae bacterium]